MIVADDAERRRALDPARSLIVQAPAGSGKTTLLVARYLRLLAGATRPDELLAITFTRKAADEMRERILAALVESSSPEARAALARNRELGWGLLEQPVRLRVQTIDAFAASLVAQLPAAAGLDRRLRITERALALYERAAQRVLARIKGDDPLAPLIARVLALHDNDAATATTAIATMLARRDQWLSAATAILESRTDPDFEQRIRSVLDHLHRTLRERLRTALGDDGLARFDTSVADAAYNLGVEQPGGAFGAGRFLTDRGRLRERLDRRTGFPPEGNVRERAQRVLDDLRRSDVAGLLGEVRALPERLTPGEVDDLVAACATLSIGVLELSGVFRETGRTDFTELLLAARRALTSAHGPSELALALDYRIRHILVDEFQDTSQAQFELFELMVDGWGGSDATLFAVGDPMQAIYGFRGADVDLYLRAARHGIGQVALARVALTCNFRSDPALVDWCNRVFARLFDQRHDALTHIPHAPSVAFRAPHPGAQVLGTRFADSAAEHDALIRHVTRLVGEHPSESIALLVRSRSHVAELLPALRAAGIRWQATDLDPLSHTPIVRDLLTAAAALADSHDRLAWFALLRAPFIGLELADIQACAGLAGFDVQSLARASGSMSDDGRERVIRLAAALERAAARIDELPPRTVLESFWLDCGGPDAYGADADRGHALRLFEMVDRLGPLGLDPVELHDAVDGLFASDPEPAPLAVMTIHRAKGLEFDHVLLPFLDRGARPTDRLAMYWKSVGGELLAAAATTEGPSDLYDWLRREARTSEREELKRLLYVACTRARTSLWLSAVAPDDRAPAGSLLALVAEELRHFETDTEQAVPAARLHPAPTGRLPRGYRPPDDLPDALVLPAPSRRDTDRPTGDGVASRAEVALGTLLHETLQRLTLAALPDDPDAWCTAQAGHWRARLVELGIGREHVARLATEAARQVAAVLSDADGRWLLSPHPGAASEWPLTGIDGGELLDVVIDRTFVHEGVRWIVDYKTGAAGTSIDVFLRDQIVRHAPQLARYARLAGALVDLAAPIRTAIYFTAIPRLVPLDDPGGRGYHRPP